MRRFLKISPRKSFSAGWEESDVGRTTCFLFAVTFNKYYNVEHAYLNLRASRSDSMRVRMSPSRTGPLTLRMMRRFWSSRNLTRTWVTCPRDPVLPMTFMTMASLIPESCRAWGVRARA